jgi:hypothetical protein
MTADVFDLAVGDGPHGDFLFTRKRKRWSHEKLRKLVEKFRLRGAAEEWWPCKSHKKIDLDDRAYLLAQDKPMGIFGRGTIERKHEKEVLIRFDRSHGDVLWDPEKDGFLVDESLLRTLRVLKDGSPIRAAGMPLEKNAARAIDRKILDLVRIGLGETTPTDETAQEVARVESEQLMRPEQRLFSETMRKNYRNKCAVTGCITPAALEAAHIKTQARLDDNSPSNGILLRSDIHCLFDQFLITLSKDGTKIETSPELTDPGYAALKGAPVAPPVGGPRPSAKNIRQHRKRFRNQG